MKTTIKSIIVIAAMLLCGSCTKLVYEVPETITISGHVTDEDGQPVENVGLSLMCIQSSNLLGFYVGTGIYGSTDANGYYSIEFNPKQGYSYRMDIGKGGYHDVPSYSVDRWIASQEHNVVLRKNTEYVDLGLPSHLLWATCNVGATKPEGLGDYFAWAEISPKAIYSRENYEHSNEVSNQLTKYCNNPSYGNNHFIDTLTVVLPTDDAGWCNCEQGTRIPSKEQWQELHENTTQTWTTLNGVRGVLFQADNGNSIFLPAAGWSYSEEPDEQNTNCSGNYWLNSIDTDCPSYAWSAVINSDPVVVANGIVSTPRYYGLSIRPVRPYGWPFCPTD